MAGFLARWAAGPEPTSAPATPAPTDDFWYQPVGASASSGVDVTAEAALSVPAVYRGVFVLAGSVASISGAVYQNTAAGREVADDHPISDLLRLAPSEEMSAYTFWETFTANLVIFNRAYAEIVPGPRGFADQLIPMRSDCVRPVRLSNGKLAFEVIDPVTGRQRTLLRDEVFYTRARSLGEWAPPSLLTRGKETIGNLIALSRMLGKQFRNGARLSGVLEHPQRLSEEAAKQISRSWHQQYAGAENAGRTAVLEEGMTFKQLSQSNTDAQLLEHWQHYIEEVARLIGVPAILLGRSDKTSTYASAEQFFQSYVNDSLRPLVENLQDAVNQQLLLDRRTYSFEFNIQSLMRGDHAARAAYYKSGIEAGWLTPNEARELENLNDKPGGDDLRMPLNMTTAGQPPADNQGTAP